MEENSCDSVRSANNFIKSTEIFENNLKQKLKWSNQEWMSKGEVNSRMHRLCKSMHYWKTKLKPAMEDVSIIVTLYNEENNVKIELVEIIAAIENLNENFKVKGIAGFRNPRYVCIYFENKEIKEKVMEQFRILENNYVIYLSWALKGDPAFNKLSVHWMPLTINLEVVKQKLEKYVTFIEEERRNLVFMSGREMPTAKIDFKIKYKENITEEIIPHLMEINKMEALVTIEGRKPLCLNCDRLGHISKNCDLRYCMGCKALKTKVHTCDTDNKSYADTLKTKNLKDTDRDPDNEDENTVLISKQDLFENKLLIENKIQSIQKQLKNSNPELTEVRELSKDAKRKIDQSFLEEAGTSDADRSSGDWAEDDESTSGSNMDFSIEETLAPDLNNLNSALKADGNVDVKKEQNSMGMLLNKSKIRKKKRKKKVGTNKDTLPSFFGKNSVEDNKDAKITKEIHASYGKPIPFNKRKIQEQKKFDKLVEKSSETRSFIFED